MRLGLCPESESDVYKRQVPKCVQMIDACKAARVKLMIAYRLHYEPITLKALDMVRSGKFGLIQSMEANKGSNIRAGEWRITKALGGGGPMFDHGVYCINTFRMFTGQEPVAFQALISTPDRDARYACLLYTSRCV